MYPPYSAHPHLGPRPIYLYLVPILYRLESLNGDSYSQPEGMDEQYITLLLFLLFHTT